MPFGLTKKEREKKEQADEAKRKLEQLRAKQDARDKWLHAFVNCKCCGKPNWSTINKDIEWLERCDDATEMCILTYIVCSTCRSLFPNGSSGYSSGLYVGPDTNDRLKAFPKVQEELNRIRNVRQTRRAFETQRELARQGELAARAAASQNAHLTSIQRHQGLAAKPTLPSPVPAMPFGSIPVALSHSMFATHPPSPAFPILPPLAPMPSGSMLPVPSSLGSFGNLHSAFGSHATTPRRAPTHSARAYIRIFPSEAALNVTECPICAQKLSENRSEYGAPVSTTCGHQFHENCLLQALESSSNQCPLCRETLL